MESSDNHPRDRQGPLSPPSDTVSRPYRDAEPPKRSKAPVIWIVVALVVIVALAIALFVAAVQKSS